MRIQEGDVARVGCPDPRCVKDNREAAGQEVSQVNFRSPASTLEMVSRKTNTRTR